MEHEALFDPVATEGTILGDEVYARLGEAILDGRLQPGAQLRDIDLAAWLDVSRTPVREALQRLERIGLVEVSAKRYTRVSVPTPRTHADTREFAVLFLGNALLLALRRCSDDALTEVIVLVDKMIEASDVDDHPSLRLRYRGFFERITHATDNGAFLRLMNEGHMAILRNLEGWTVFIEDPTLRTASYRELRDAIGARDGRSAEAILRRLHGLA